MQTKRKEEIVTLASIEKELSRLWESYDAAGKIRACLFTLVVYCEDRKRLSYLQQLIRMVVERFPCRIISIHGQVDREEEYLEISVSTETSRKGETTIACDRISITAGKAALNRVPFLILPHLVPDLPVYLFWGQDPTAECNVLPHLEKFCHRFIFDSDFTTDLKRFTTQLLARLGSHPNKTIDVTWARLRAWRDITAQAFNTPTKLMQLAQSKNIEITYHNQHDIDCTHAHFAATYFQAWLSGRLTWKPVCIDRLQGQQRITYTNGIQQCQIVLKPVNDADLPPGVLMGLNFTSHQEETCSIQRLDASRMVRISFSSKNHCDIPITTPLSTLDRNSMLMNEIFYKDPSDHYRTMLQMLAQLQINQ